MGINLLMLSKYVNIKTELSGLKLQHVVARLLTVRGCIPKSRNAVYQQ